MVQFNESSSGFKTKIKVQNYGGKFCMMTIEEQLIVNEEYEWDSK